MVVLKRNGVSVKNIFRLREQRCAKCKEHQMSGYALLCKRINALTRSRQPHPILA